MIVSSTMATASFANHYDGKIQRNLFGKWVEENFGNNPRYFPGTGSTTKFEQLAKMVAFLEGKDATAEYLQQIEVFLSRFFFSLIISRTIKRHMDAIAGKTALQMCKNLEEDNTWTLSMLFAQSSTGNLSL